MQYSVYAARHSTLPSTRMRACAMQASKGTAPLVQLLLQHGAKHAKDSTGATPLHRAAAVGKLDNVRALLEGGARIDAKDRTGATPLFTAVSCQQSNTALYLASQGADLEAATRDEETPLSVAGADLAAALQRARQSGIEMD